MCNVGLRVTDAIHMLPPRSVTKGQQDPAGNRELVITRDE
jgi:hypothetical protein